MQNKSVLGIFVTIAFASSVILSLSAFGADSSPFGLGIHAGANLNDLSVSSSASATLNANENSTTGVVVGAHLELGSEMLMLRPEANYSVHSYNYSGVADVTHKYLEIPVLVKLCLLPAPIQPFVEAGPQLGIHLADSVTALGVTTNFSDNSNSTDWAGVAGAGLRVGAVPGISLEAEARYVFGFTNQSSESNVNVKTRGFQILGGITARI